MFLNSLKQLFVTKESTINLRSNPELERTLVNSVLKGKEFLTLISIGFFGVAHRRWGGAKSPPPPSSPPYNLSHISYNDKTWHSYTLPTKRSKKYMNHVTHLLSSTASAFFFTANQQILLYKEIQRYFNIKFLIFSIFWSLKDCFNKHGYNFEDFSKAALGLLKIKVF